MDGPWSKGRRAIPPHCGLGALSFCPVMNGKGVTAAHLPRCYFLSRVYEPAVVSCKVLPNRAQQPLESARDQRSSSSFYVWGSWGYVCLPPASLTLSSRRACSAEIYGLP